MKNLIRKILKEEEDLDWMRDVEPMKGNFVVTFCDIDIREGDELTNTMKIVEKTFGEVAPPTFNSERIKKSIGDNVSDELDNSGNIVLYVNPSPYLIDDGGCHIGWNTCRTFERYEYISAHKGEEQETIYTHQEFKRIFG